VVENKEVELKFTIALEHASFLFDGGKRPKDKGADWKPSHAIASWASWSTKKDKAGREEVVTTANAPFVRKEAARIEMCRESAASALQVKWCDAAASAAEIKKKLKQKPGGNAFEDQIIQISLFAANQDFYKPKDGCAAAPKPPTQKPPFHCGPCASSLREPIHQAHLPLRARRHAGIMGRDDEGHPVFLPKLQQQVHHAITGVGIQVAGGFIRQHECG
jgi:hypothetical protein